jgi:hypothetical protein
MQLTEWFMSLFITASEGSELDGSQAEALWSLIVNWAERRRLGIGGNYRPEGPGFLFEYGVCATEEDQLIDEDEMRELLRVISAAIAGRGVASGGFRAFTDEESDPVRLDELIEVIRRSIN